MCNYHTALVWAIDKILFILAASLAMAIIVYSIVRESIAARRNARLQRIKENVYGLFRPSDSSGKAKCPAFVTDYTPQQFLDITTNRETILFTDEERRYIKQCFVDPKKISQLKKIARRAGNKWRRIEAILSLGYLGSDSALDLLKGSLSDRDEDIAYFSKLALGQIKTVSSAKILLDFLERRVFSAYKVVSLLESFPAEAAREIIKKTQSPDAYVRYWMVKLLSKFRPAHYVKEIEELAGDEADDVRAAAVECLGMIGRPEAKRTLLESLKDRAWFVRMHAVNALSNILGPASIPEVINLLKDTEWFVKESVKRAVARHIEAALPYIEKILYEGGEREDEVAKRHCVEALESSGYIDKMFRGCLSEDANKRKAAIHLLKGMINAYAHSGLETSLGYLDEGSRLKVLEVISQINAPLAEHIAKKIKGQFNEL